MNFILEWDWAREDISPDWSVTAWAEQGDVKITHSKGIESDKLPYIAPKEEEAEAEEETAAEEQS